MGRLSATNNLLFALVLLINGYIIGVPIYPKVMFWLQSHGTSQVSRLEKKAKSPPPQTTPTVPRDNRLIVPSMLLDEPINEGSQIALRKGLWRRPATSTPNKDSNTVIVGHRFTYTNPRGVLYNLDKVHLGDTATVWWSGKAYSYTIISTEVVRADATYVEKPTDISTLTIYTCTPLWLPKDRLVVTARLKEIIE